MPQAGGHENSLCAFNHSLHGALDGAVGLRSVWRAGVMTPTKGSTGFDEFFGIVRIYVFDLIIWSNALHQIQLGGVGILVQGWVGHQDAGVLVQHTKRTPLFLSASAISV